MNDLECMVSPDGLATRKGPGVGVSTTPPPGRALPVRPRIALPALASHTTKRAPAAAIVTGRGIFWGGSGTPSGIVGINGSSSGAEDVLMSESPITAQVESCLRRWAQGEEAARD